MTVLVASLFPFVVGALLTLGGGQGVHLNLAALLVAHNFAGYVSWTCHYQSWGQRVFWLLALGVHALTYTIHRTHYFAIDDVLLQNLVVLGVIVVPSGLMCAGPFNAIMRR